jgi:hypothetical protein
MGAEGIEFGEVRLEVGLRREATGRGRDVGLEADREAVVRHAGVGIDVGEKSEHACLESGKIVSPASV